MHAPAHHGSLFEPVLKNLEYVPLADWPNAALVKLKASTELEPADAHALTEADWDQFERDIADACERVDASSPESLA